MNLEIFENGRKLNCGIEGHITGTFCPYDAFAVAHLKDFVFFRNEISPLPGSETIISICPSHRSHLEIKYEEFAVTANL